MLPNPSSTRLVSSTAEGRPIPVDGSTVENRTSALRELNSHYPSRHRYAKSTGAQSSTYSEPVIVRSYYSPLPHSRPSSSSRGAVVIHGGAISGSGVQSGGSIAGTARTLPFASKVVSAGNGMLSTMVRARTKKPLNGRTEDEARLPPMEAFTFKSFMANMEAQAQGQGGGTGADINADLDRIAEICARSRYSLSNQYEVHYTPHGSGSSFLPGSTHASDASGPTLQAVTSDDERSIATSSNRRRRLGARRNSRAMGTLETIMSSSRSSDEEKSSRKKPAAEIADEIRGRAATKAPGNSSPRTSSRGTTERQRSQKEQSPSRPPPPKRSASSLALIDVARQVTYTADSTAPRTSATALVSEPAQPQASNSQLEIRTTTGQLSEHHPSSSHLKGSPDMPNNLGLSVAKGAISPISVDTTNNGIFSILNGWIPWKSSDTPSTQPQGRAEGSLRQLLRMTEFKGKGLERST